LATVKEKRPAPRLRLAARPRTAGAHDRTGRYRSRDWGAACARSASGRLRPGGRWYQTPPGLVDDLARRRGDRRVVERVAQCVLVASSASAAGSPWPSRSATVSTRNWLTRVGLPEPDTGKCPSQRAVVGCRAVCCWHCRRDRLTPQHKVVAYPCQPSSTQRGWFISSFSPASLSLASIASTTPLSRRQKAR
jgi:hypothetical protein